MLRGLCRLEFSEVFFQPRQGSPRAEGEAGGEEEQDNGEAVGGDGGNDDNKKVEINDPILSLRRSLAVLLPHCSVVFTNCCVQTNSD